MKKRTLLHRYRWANPFRTHPGPAWGTMAGLLPILAVLTVIFMPLRPMASVQAPPDEAVPAAELLRQVDAADRVAYDDARRQGQALQAEESFLQVQLLAARRPAITLAVNLHDSVAIVSIQGVPVLTSPIQHSRRSAFFDDEYSGGAGGADLQSPFILDRATATIPKVPVRMIQAPRDSAEAQRQQPAAFVVDNTNAYVNLYFDRTLTVYLIPSTRPLDDRLAGAWMNLENRLLAADANIRQLLGGHAVPRERWIELTLAPEDIRAIYRALPEDAMLALRL